MSSIEEIRKINELSKTLKQHGFAEDSFDAISKAGNMVKKEEVFDLDLEEGPLVSDGSAKPDISRINSRLDSFERSKHMLNERVDAMSKRIEEMQEVIDYLRSKVSVLERKSRSEDVKREEVVVNIPNEDENQAVFAQPEKEGNAGKGHPKSGGFNPDDVSVEKIFYFGQK